MGLEAIALLLWESAWSMRADQRQRSQVKRDFSASDDILAQLDKMQPM